MPLLPVLFSALSAAVWGTGDFSGGKASQTANPLAVTLLSQLLGIPALIIWLLVVRAGGPSLTMLGRDAIAGMAGFAGIVLLYRGLARGAMAVFAPISAVTAAVIPLVYGLVAQQAPGALALIGAVCAIIAIGLVSVSGGSGNAMVTPGLVGLALASGAMFGIFFVILGQVTPAAGMWPLLGVRVGSIVLGAVVGLITRTPLRLGPGPLRWSAIAGTCDVSANALFIFAAARGQLSIVAPISALYPVSTVLLALGIDHERVRTVQLAGLGLAAVALVLVAT